MNDFMQQVSKEIGEDREFAKLARQEELILGVTEAILEKMQQRKISKSRLAELMGTDKSYVTQLLRGSRNMTLRTISDICFSLDCEVIFDVVSAKELDSSRVSIGPLLFVGRAQTTDWKPPSQPQDCVNTESINMNMAA